MPIDRGHPEGRLVAEGDRKRLLKMGPTRHRRIAVLPCEVRETIAHFAQISRNDAESRADLKHVGSVHDVLRRGPPVDVAPSLARGFRQLMDKWQNRIAEGIGFLPEFVEF